MSGGADADSNSDCCHLVVVCDLLDIAEGEEGADERACHAKQREPHRHINTAGRLHSAARQYGKVYERALGSSIIT